MIVSGPVIIEVQHIQVKLCRVKKSLDFSKWNWSANLWHLGSLLISDVLVSTAVSFFYYLRTRTVWWFV